MKQANNPTGGPWFRVPANLPALEPEEATAWTVLLGLWHGGHDPSIGEMRRRTGWGAGRMTAFMGKVSAWAAENGAAMPDRRADHKRTLKSGGDGNVIGTAAERERNVIGTVEAAEKADNKVSTERVRNESGTAAECYRNDSRAHAPFERRSDPEETEKKIMNVSPPPAAPLFAQPPAAAQEPTPPPKPEPKPKAPPAVAQLADEQAIWAAWKMFRKGGATAPPKLATAIRGALKSHPAEEVVNVIRWAYQSTHSRARFLRGGAEPGQINADGAYGLDTLLRHLDDYAALMQEQAEAPPVQPKLSALPPGMKPRGVVIDADSGKVEVEEGPQSRPSTGSKRLDLMVSAAERLRRQREIEEEEERQQQEVQNAEV